MASDLPRSPAGLADAIDRFTTALGTRDGASASGLTADDLAAQTANVAAIRAAITARDAAEAPYRAAVKALEKAYDSAEDAFRPVRRQAANHAAMTPDMRALAGLPATGARTMAAPLPAVTDLTAVPLPSGSVALDWTGPTGGSLRYEVFAVALDEDGGTWGLIGSATATDFVHRDAAPGARSAYRVEAVRGERRGEPSNEASVYA